MMAVALYWWALSQVGGLVSVVSYLDKTCKRAGGRIPDYLSSDDFVIFINDEDIDYEISKSTERHERYP